MKGLLIISFWATCLTFSGDLFDGIEFNKHGIGYKTNIPVIYQSFGKTDSESAIKMLKKNFKATSALSFIYNEKNYYIAIEEKNFPDFLSEIERGDLIFIDIIVFNTINCYSTGRQHKNYCSYISKIYKDK
jgi:hypothetical protein